LGKFDSRVVVDAKTGERFHFYTDGDAIRDVTDTGEVELVQDLLVQSGGRRHDLNGLLDRGGTR
jgi:hypothetical protein